MSDGREQPLRHQDAWELIPWLVNERASEEECRQLKLHLASCAACRGEVEVQRRLRSAIASDTRLDSVPGASLQRLWTKIAAVPDAHAVHSEASAMPAAHKRPRRRYITYSLVAAVMVEAVGLGVLGSLLSSQAGPRTSGETYHTLSTLPVAGGEATVRAVFSPDMTLSQLQTLLNLVDLQIENGPTESGVYSLRSVNTATSAEHAALRLRAQPGVRFAEPINSPEK